MSNPEFTAPNFNTQTATAYKTNLDAAIVANGPFSNLGFSYSGGTFTVHGHEGTALASTNPAFVRFQDPDNFGHNKYISIEANQDFIDDAGASEIIGNLFGFPTGVAVGSDVRFYLYAVSNDAMDSVAFMISRMSHHTTSPAFGSIGAPDDAVADTIGSFFSLESLDETLYDSNPCVCIGSFRMQMSSSDDWTVQALGATDGIGVNCERNNFTPRSRARLASTVSNVTGDSTDYTILYDTEDIDTSLFDTTTGTFTAPRAGYYSIFAICRASGILSSHVGGSFRVNTSNRQYESKFHTYNVAANSSAYTPELTTMVDMDEGDTLYISFDVDGGTKVIDVQGDPTDGRSSIGIVWVGEL